MIVFFFFAYCGGPVVYVQWRNRPPEFPQLPDDAVELQRHEKQCGQAEAAGHCHVKDYYTEEPIEALASFYEDQGATCLAIYDSNQCTTPGCEVSSYTCKKSYTSTKWYAVHISRNVARDRTFRELEVTVGWEKYDFYDLAEDILTVIVGT